MYSVYLLKWVQLKHELVIFFWKKWFKDILETWALSILKNFIVLFKQQNMIRRIYMEKLQEKISKKTWK